MKIQLPHITCKRCGHTWTPRLADVRKCPRCKTAHFDSKRRVVAIATVLVFMALVGTARADNHFCRTATGEINSHDPCKAGEVIADVSEADDAMVAGCKYLGDVTASSGWGGLMQGVGQSRSRDSVFKRAAQKGANHIVWSRQASGSGGANASARAYKCETVE